MSMLESGGSRARHTDIVRERPTPRSQAQELLESEQAKEQRSQHLAAKRAVSSNALDEFSSEDSDDDKKHASGQIDHLGVISESALPVEHEHDAFSNSSESSSNDSEDEVNAKLKQISSHRPSPL